MAINAEEFGVMKSQITSIKETVDNMNEKLFLGNGQPSIMVTMNKNCTAISELTTDVAIVSKNTKELSEIIRGHINCKDLHHPREWMLKNWRILLFIVIIVCVIVQALFPDNLTIWDLLKAI